MEVYKIVNTINNKIYVGSTKYTKEYRWGTEGNSGFSHLACMRSGGTAPLYEDMRKYGPEVFKIVTLETLPNNTTAKYLAGVETKYIREYIRDGYVMYNRIASAKGSTDGSQMRTPEVQSRVRKTIMSK